MESALDVAVTVSVVHSLIHIHWTGVTAFLDQIIFPTSPWLSALTSLIIGYGLCYAILTYEDHAKQISKDCEKESEMKQIAFEDICTLVGGFAVITTWRGIWVCFDILANNYPILYIRGCDVTPLLVWMTSFILIAMAKITSSLPYQGCERDGDIKDGEGLSCYTEYFMDFLKNLNKEEEELKQKKTAAEEETKENNNAPASNDTKYIRARQKKRTRLTPGVDGEVSLRRRVRAIEHAKNISKQPPSLNGTINYDIDIDDIDLEAED